MRYYTHKDYPTLLSWYEGHGEPCPREAALSLLGLIDENCAAFLYLTSSSLCFIENLVTNPFVPKELREESMTKMIDELVLKAKGKTIVCFTDILGVAKRAKKHGFKIHQDRYFLVSKEA